MAKIVAYYNKYINYILIAFSVFILLFPTIRIGVIGNDRYRNLTEFLLTEAPDLISVCIILFSFLIYWSKRKVQTGSLLFFDKVFVCYYIINLIWGAILLVKGGNISHDLFFFFGGFKLTYLPMLFYFVGRIYGVSALNVESHIDIKQLLNGIFKIFLGLAIIGLIIYLIPNLQKQLLANFAHYVPGEYFIQRMTSILWTPVFFAFLMAFSAIYFYYQIIQEKNKINYLYFGIIWLSLFLTVSRGGIIAFLIGFIFITVLLKKWKQALLCFVLMFVIASSVSLIAIGSLKMLIWIFKSSAETMQNDQGITRVNLWQASYDAFCRKPWGYGIGKAGWLAFRYLKNDPNAVPWATDGWYLKTACESGIIGLASFLALQVIYFIKTFRFVISDKSTLVTLFLVAFVMVSFQSIVSNIIDFSPYITLFWLMMGISQSILVNKLNLTVVTKS